ncbi:hypothetical protein K438DRAFT_1973517 [Mycena galopus ATCC 62051]|nr:hypothetical protein K438DRAFT_1973517 [Mycena galopus ATCC 62051]
MHGPQGLTNFNDTGLKMIQYGTPNFLPPQGTTEPSGAANFAEGHFGILGLGFDLGATSTAGQSVLSHIFAQNLSQSDYIGIALSRTGDQEGTADGSLTIAEYYSDYASGQIYGDFTLLAPQD